MAQRQCLESALGTCLNLCHVTGNVLTELLVHQFPAIVYASPVRLLCLKLNAFLSLFTQQHLFLVIRGVSNPFWLSAFLSIMTKFLAVFKALSDFILIFLKYFAMRAKFLLHIFVLSERLLRSCCRSSEADFKLVCDWLAIYRAGPGFFGASRPIHVNDGDKIVFGKMPFHGDDGVRFEGLEVQALSPFRAGHFTSILFTLFDSCGGGTGLEVTGFDKSLSHFGGVTLVSEKRITGFEVVRSYGQAQSWRFGDIVIQLDLAQ
ncbi:hypothetical protein Tco_1056865 [Tanacetum coccineum]|uniref:Uncharacterized protein n=1 Tax=Tanacetum coccineum TaxID=301880 RepID=A0ABQ5H5Y4_9ASTR